jgi:hypothetical protein
MSNQEFPFYKILCSKQSSSSNEICQKSTFSFVSGTNSKMSISQKKDGQISLRDECNINYQINDVNKKGNFSKLESAIR